MKIKRNNAIRSRGGQRGAVLVMGLVLLMVLTILGVSGMNTATLELAMAGNAQFHQAAFQAAETGIDISIAQRNFNTLAPAILPVTPLGGGTAYSTQAVATYMTDTPIPAGAAFSLGMNTGAVAAYHFDVTAIGQGPRNAASTHTQSFYVVGPGGL
jgi:type IV pilus assembly protein PilX